MCTREAVATGLLRAMSLPSQRRHVHWTKEGDEEPGLCLAFPQISMHAIIRATEDTPAAVYVQIASDDAEFEEEEEEEEDAESELWFVPAEPEQGACLRGGRGSCRVDGAHREKKWGPGRGVRCLIDRVSKAPGSNPRLCVARKRSMPLARLPRTQWTLCTRPLARAPSGTPTPRTETATVRERLCPGS